jgi:hypothetical protein
LPGLTARRLLITPLNCGVFIYPGYLGERQANKGKQKMQLTLKLDAGLAESYGTCREYVASRVHHQGRPQKAIAADMDYSPSDLSRKLAQNPDDLEKFMAVSGDKSPILYLVEKYLVESEGEIEILKRRLAELEGKKPRAVA